MACRHYRERLPRAFVEREELQPFHADFAALNRSDQREDLLLDLPQHVAIMQASMAAIGRSMTLPSGRT